MNFIWVLSIPRTTLQFPPKKPNWSWKTSMQLGSEVSKGFSKMMVIACLDSEFKVLEKWYEKHSMRLNQWLSALSFLIFFWGGLDVFGWCFWCISAFGRHLLVVREHVWSHQLVWEKKTFLHQWNSHNSHSPTAPKLFCGAYDPEIFV